MSADTAQTLALLTVRGYHEEAEYFRSLERELAQARADIEERDRRIDKLDGSCKHFIVQLAQAREAQREEDVRLLGEVENPVAATGHIWADWLAAQPLTQAGEGN